MNTYTRLLRLLENTPSKTEVAVKKALGWPIRPEDEPGISNATRRIRVRARGRAPSTTGKKTRGGRGPQRPGSMLSTGSTRRLRRKLGSDVFSTGTEKGAIAHMLTHKTKKTLKRLERRHQVGEEAEEPRIARRARLRNREAGSMLTRNNQRRLTKAKAAVRSIFKRKN
tara:strand:- start:557 stop:1063 length:507 start_codon:yes stop_codon:yes gene_type:complete